MAYALKLDGEVVPLTGLIDPQVLLQRRGQHDHVRAAATRCASDLFELFSTRQLADVAGRSPEAAALLPAADRPCRGELTYDNIFRVIIMQFLDAHDFDVRSVKKSCIHIVHPDGRIIPFDTYNMFYRDGREASCSRRCGARARGPALAGTCAGWSLAMVEDEAEHPEHPEHRTRSAAVLAMGTDRRRAGLRRQRRCDADVSDGRHAQPRESERRC